MQVTSPTTSLSHLLLLAVVGLGACSSTSRPVSTVAPQGAATKVAAPAPPARIWPEGLITDTPVVVGRGKCRTFRRAVRQTDEGIEVVIDRPNSGECRLAAPVLVLGDVALTKPSYGAGMAQDKQRPQLMVWTASQGRLLFRTSKKITRAWFVAGKPADLGITDENCRDFSSGNGQSRESADCLADERLAGLPLASMKREGEIQEALANGSFERLLADMSSGPDTRLQEAALAIAAREQSFGKQLAVYKASRSAAALAAAEATAIQAQSPAELLALYQAARSDSTLRAGVDLAKRQRSVEQLVALHAASSDPAVLTEAITLAKQTRSFADLALVYRLSQDREVLKLQYDVAVTNDEKRAVELAVIEQIKDKLFVFSATMQGTGKTSSSDVDALIVRSISSQVKSKISYDTRIQTDIFKPSYDYVVNAEMVLVVYGRLNGERNCGLLWMQTCKIDDEPTSHTHRYPVQLRVGKSTAYRAAGVTEVDWSSVSGGSGMAGGLIMGGTQVFTATGKLDLSIRLTSLTVSP